MILIRADANKQIGMGHIMRSLSLADAFHTAGQDVEFVLADREVSDYVESRGFRTIVLNSSYINMEGELSHWPNIKPDCIVIDSYFVTPGYLSQLSEKARTVYLDDLAAFPYPVNGLINYNVYADRQEYSKLYKGNLPNCAFGPAYTPLRRMFMNIPPKVQPKECRSVFFSTGGADALHITLKLIKQHPENNIFHIIVGAMNADKDIVREKAKECSNIIIHENVTDMKSLICSCDMAVSAAGSTLYEICACGVPMITYITADNQIKGAEAFEKMGLAVNCGDLRGKDGLESVVERIESLASNYHQRVKMGLKMQKIIDGRGTERTIGIINKWFPNIIETTL